jgi:cytochrome c oxidase subunit 2
MTMDWFTTSTEAVNTAFYIIVAVSVAMLVLVTVLMVVFAVKYRRKRHPQAVQIKGNVLLEIVWTVIPTLLALGMFYIGWVGFKVMRKVPEGALEVTAKARMWSWEFVYENGKSSDELYVPQGVPVRVDLQSADVIHSFYVPAYRIKQDIVPGVETYTWFQPVDTGKYDIFCAEYCGQRHAYMMSKVVVVPEEEFRTWIETDVAPPAVPAEGEGAEEERRMQLRKSGERLSKLKGCNACHSTDGTRLVGPTYKGLFGKTESVVTGGETRQLVVDEEYVRRSIVEPGADVVEGYDPVMPKVEMTEEELAAIIEYLKTL